MDVTWYMIVILSILLIGIAFTIGLYIWSREFYLKHRVAIRKVYYGCVVTSAFCLWVSGVFPDVRNNLQHLIALVISIVIIDLFVFQTPDITKFMSNELKQEGLIENINKNRGTFIELSEKLIRVNQLMPKNLSDWIMDDFEFTPGKYEEAVLSYLGQFAADFRLDVYAYMVEADPDESEFKKNITNAYKQVMDDHKLSLRGVGMRENRAINTMLEGKNIEIIDGECSSVLFPYFGEYYNFLFLVSSRQKVEVTGADASLMLNLLCTFDLWLQSNEDEFWPHNEEEDELQTGD